MSEMKLMGDIDQQVLEKCLKKIEEPCPIYSSIRPPIGIMPRSVVREQRIGSLLGAIWRYVEAGYVVPAEWETELHDILKDHNNNSIKTNQ